MLVAQTYNFDFYRCPCSLALLFTKPGHIRVRLARRRREALTFFGPLTRMRAHGLVAPEPAHETSFSSKLLRPHALSKLVHCGYSRLASTTQPKHTGSVVSPVLCHGSEGAFATPT